MNVKSAVVVFTLSLVCATSVRATTWYFQGDDKAYNATDNARDTEHGYWWNSKGTPTAESLWGYPVSGENAYINNGHRCIIPSGMTLTDADVLSICVGVQGSTAGSRLTIENGATVSGVGITTGGVGGYEGKNGELLIDGGNVSLGNANYSLCVGSANAGKTSIGSAWMTGGTLTIGTKDFLVGKGNASTGAFTLSNGTVRVVSNTYVGYQGDSETNTASFVQTGGSFTETGTFYLSSRNSTVELSGGAFTSQTVQVERNAKFIAKGDSWVDIPRIKVKNGGSLRVEGEAFVCGGINAKDSGEKETAGLVDVTNLIEIAGGTLCVTNPNAAGWVGSQTYPMLIRQSGGVFKPDEFKVGSTKNFNQYIISGGEIRTGLLYLNYCPVLMKIIGDKGILDFEKFTCTGGTGASATHNSIVEYVIRKGGVSSIDYRATSSTTAFGHDRVYPEGGFGIISTNSFALFRAANSSSISITKTVKPDEAIWDSSVVTVNGGREYRAVLRDGASSGALAFGQSLAFAEPVPSGFVDIPSIKTNGLNKILLKAKVLPPTEGVTLETTLATVSRDLVEAGYADVATDPEGEDFNVSFSVLPEMLPAQSRNTRLLFDFTRIVYPDTFVADEDVDYAVTTNALVSSIAIDRDRDAPGMMLILR